MKTNVLSFPSRAAERRTLVNAGEVVNFTCDPFGRTTDVDPAFHQLTGVTIEECRAGAWIDRIHPDDAGRYMRTFYKAVSTGRPFKATARFLATPTQVYITLTVSMSPRTNHKGAITHWRGLIAFRADDLLITTTPLASSR